jgi:FkbM family methyltransferase
LYTPHLLAQRIADALATRYRLRRLRNTEASDLLLGHIDSLELLDIVQADLRPTTIYDIGASGGTWTLLARTICPQAEVHAFEPLDYAVHDFDRRAGKVGRVTLHKIALGAAPKSASMFVLARADASSVLPPVGTESPEAEGRVCSTVNVQMDSLDHYVAVNSLPAPDLIKLDVQGYELEVLRGGSESLSKARAVITEVSFREFYRGQSVFSDMVAFLGARGLHAAAFARTFPTGARLAQTDVLFCRP